MSHTREYLAALIGHARRAIRPPAIRRFFITVCIGCCASLSHLGVTPAFGQILPLVPQMPIPPTPESCAKFSRQVWAQLSQVYQDQSQCMRRESARIGPGLECNGLTGVVSRTISAWPQCFTPNANNQCELIRLRASGDACMRQAQGNSAKSKKTVEAVNKMSTVESRGRSLITAFQNTRDAFNDPRAFIKGQLEGRLRSDMLSTVRQENGDLNPGGIADLQGVYDYLFNKTLANESLASSNPVVRAIQGEAAAKIRQAHNASLAQMGKLVESINSIDGKANQTDAPASSVAKPRPVSRAGAGNSDCALLDSAARTDFALDHPDEYEALVKRCR